MTSNKTCNMRGHMNELDTTTIELESKAESALIVIIGIFCDELSYIWFDSSFFNKKSGGFIDDV